MHSQHHALISEGYPTAGWIVVLLLTAACAIGVPPGVDVSLLPKASPDAREILYLQANVPCEFFVDGQSVVKGKRVRVLVTNQHHQLVCKPDGYRAKEDYVQPPFDPNHPIGFTFLLEDKLPEKQITEMPTKFAAPPAEVKNQQGVGEGAILEGSLKRARPPEPPKEIASGAAEFGLYFALVIGNNDYKHLPKLRTAVSDAQAVAAVLMRKYGFKVTLLTNANRTETILALDQLRAALTERDNLLIYYAGHGLLDRGSDRGYWLPVDAQDNTTAQWIATTSITDTLKAMSAKHVLVVADSCYSGTMLRDLTPTLKSGAERQAYLKRLAGKRARTVLTSGGVEPVLDEGGGEHSLFAKHFLGALEENSAALEGQELFVKIRRPVTVNSDQMPEYGDIRLAGHEGGDFVFMPSMER